MGAENGEALGNTENTTSFQKNDEPGKEHVEQGDGGGQTAVKDREYLIHRLNSEKIFGLMKDEVVDAPSESGQAGDGQSGTQTLCLKDRDVTKVKFETKLYPENDVFRKLIAFLSKADAGNEGNGEGVNVAGEDEVTTIKVEDVSRKILLDSAYFVDFGYVVREFLESRQDSGTDKDRSMDREKIREKCFRLLNDGFSISGKGGEADSVYLPYIGGRSMAGKNGGGESAVLFVEKSLCEKLKAERAGEEQKKNCQYSILQLNGRALLDGVRIEKDDHSNWKPVFKFDKESSFRRIIESSSMYRDNSFLWQMKRCLFEDGFLLLRKYLDNIDFAENLLLDSLYFVNFQNVYKDPIIDPDYDAESKNGGSLTEEKWKGIIEKGETDKICYRLFRDGFTVTKQRYDEESHKTVIESKKTYLPFDKSNSMARESRIIFIEESLYKRMDKAILLGYDLSSIKTSLSKLYAYRGLSLTGAQRIFDKELVLNEETVVVIADDDSPLKIKNIYTAEQRGDNIKYSEWKPKKTDEGKEEEEIELDPYTRFDGEGLVSKEYADIINSSMGSSGKERRSSFQIRMPFSKGMLHEVDFHKFFKEELVKFYGLPEDFYDHLYIEDVFGITRKLSDVKIIMTKSMFKCCSWLQKAVSKTEASDSGNPETGKPDSSDPDSRDSRSNEPDPMKSFFRRFHEFDYAMYIANTDYEISRNDVVKLNYQFLNTLKLEKDKFETLVNNHLQKAQELLTNVDAVRKRFRIEAANDIRDDEGANVPDVDSSSEEMASFLEPWKLALQKNEDFMSHPKIKGQIRGMMISLVRDVGIGKIEVDGKLLFLSQDLLALLRHILGKVTIDNKKDKKSVGKEEEEKFRKASEKLGDIIKGNALRSGQFFISDEEFFSQVGEAFDRKKDEKKDAKGGSRFDPDLHYGVLRSPHLSRNEECLMEPYIPGYDPDKREKEIKDSPRTKFYREYFGHLKGVFMIPYDSDTAIILGGADFDGDMVKLVKDQEVNKAIFNGVYEIEEKEKGERRLCRRKDMPIIRIPDTKKGDSKEVPERMDYETIRNTFSGRVGLISNAALVVSKKKYYEYDPGQRLNGIEPDLLDPAYYTILTGLEIDAAKTGIRPVLPEIKTSHDEFLKLKDEIKKLLQDKERFFSMAVRHSGDEWQLVIDGKGKGTKAAKSIVVFRTHHKDQDNKDNIDCLPYLLLKHLQENVLRPARELAAEQEADSEASGVNSEAPGADSGAPGVDSMAPGADSGASEADSGAAGNVPDEDRTASGKVRTVKRYFRFAEGRWRTRLDKDILNKISVIYNTYSEIRAFSRDIFEKIRSMRNVNYSNCIYMLLKIRDGDAGQLMPLDEYQDPKQASEVQEMRVDDIISSTYNIILHILEEETRKDNGEMDEAALLRKIEEILKGFKDAPWYAVGNEPNCPASASQGQNMEQQNPTPIEETDYPASGLQCQNTEQPNPTPIEEGFLKNDVESGTCSGDASSDHRFQMIESRAGFIKKFFEKKQGEMSQVLNYLFDFSSQGYMLLYYILKDIDSIFKSDHADKFIESVKSNRFKVGDDNGTAGTGGNGGEVEAAGTGENDGEMEAAGTGGNDDELQAAGKGQSEDGDGTSETFGAVKAEDGNEPEGTVGPGSKAVKGSDASVMVRYKAGRKSKSKTIEIDMSLFQKFLGIYMKATSDKLLKKDWLKRVERICGERMRDVLREKKIEEADVDQELMKYLYSISRTSDLFWNARVIPPEVFEKQLAETEAES